MKAADQAKQEAIANEDYDKAQEMSQQLKVLQENALNNLNFNYLETQLQYTDPNDASVSSKHSSNMRLEIRKIQTVRKLS